MGIVSVTLFVSWPLTAFLQVLSKDHSSVFPSAWSGLSPPSRGHCLCNPDLGAGPHLTFWPFSPPISQCWSCWLLCQPDIFQAFFNLPKPHNFPSFLLSKDVIPGACPQTAFLLQALQMSSPVPVSTFFPWLAGVVIYCHPTWVTWHILLMLMFAKKFLDLLAGGVP